MSGRGGGRGRGGGGRGRGREQQASSAPSQGRGRGRGGGNAAGSSGHSAPAPWGSKQPSVSASTSSSAALSRDFERSVALGSPAPAPAVAPVQPAVQPAAQPQQLVKQAPASSKAIRPPARPGFGTLGAKCRIRANHFLVNVNVTDIYHYDINISPEVTSKKVCKEIIDKLVRLYRESHLGGRRLAYDGKKSAFTAGALPFESKEFPIKLGDNDGGQQRREREFKVSVKFAAKPDIEHLRQFLLGRQRDLPQETVQALDVVLRASPSIKYEVVGRSFFKPVFGHGLLGDGIDYWKGFYQSLRPTQMGLSLNIDMSARGFYQPILVSDYICEFFSRDVNRPLSDQDRVKFRKALKGLRVQVNHCGYVKSCKISSLSPLPTSQLTFPVDDTGATMSVVQYFREKYGITLKYAFLPAINTGTDAKPVYLPMEICKIVEGQRYSKKLNEKQVTALLRATCQRPRDRQSSIEGIVKKNEYHKDSIVTDFGIQVNAQLTGIEARVLQPPLLKYHPSGQEKEVVPSVGQWNMINKKMVNGAHVNFWACVNFSRQRDDVVDRFCHALISMCVSKGMSFNPRPLVPPRSTHSNNIEKTLVDIQKLAEAELARTGNSNKQLQLLIVILPDLGGSYGRIKRICETELGIVSQCCQPRNAVKLSPQYLENVALKINVKAGGRNTVLVAAMDRKIPYLTDMPTIIIGADVTHPQPGEDSSSSIAAVVGSMDWPEVTKYRALVSAQTHRQEIIADLYKSHEDPKKGLVHGGMIRELMISFRRENKGIKPLRIIFYRDGVSEGQFNQVLLEEMDSIRKACNSLEENYLPRVTFVVVQKRHHTRLFPAVHNDRNSTDRSGNILPGTVVDTSICHPTEFDFYLCSHAGIQGTSRPTHYHVLYDENNFSADALQMLTNSLCYTYARCTRSVSIVPPAYYAHLAAFRARYYVEGEFTETESTAAGRATREGNVLIRPLPAIRDNVKDVMFYC